MSTSWNIFLLQQNKMRPLNIAFFDNEQEGSPLREVDTLLVGHKCV